MMTLDIQADAASVAAFHAAMSQRAALINRGQKGIVEISAVKLITALRSAAATAISKDKRPVVANPKYVKGVRNQRNLAETNDRARAHIREYYEGLGMWGKLKRLTISSRRRRSQRRGTYNRAEKEKLWKWMIDREAVHKRPIIAVGAKTKAEANALPARLIKRRGLARRSWSWLLKALNKPTDPQDVNGVTSSTLTVRGTSDKGVEATWTGANRLEYIRSAMRRPLSESVNAAAKMLRNEAERVAAKAAA